jgi:hypothetical protein
MNPEEDAADRVPAVRRLADWLGRQWSALGQMGRTGVVLSGLAVVLLVGVGAWTDWVKETKEAPLLVAAPAPEKTDGVAAVAWLDPKSEGSTVRLWVVFRNGSAGAASDLRYLKLDTPGFRWVTCMEANGPDCRPQGRRRPPIEGSLPDLEPEQSAAVFGIVELIPRASHHGVSGVFGWRDADGTDRVGSIIVAEVPVESGLRRALAFGGHLVLFVRDLVKDLAWPVVLALLAWYLKQRDDRRDKKEQDEKQYRDEQAQRQRDEREERDRRQALLQQTWNLMLPKSHANAEKHYMPILNRVDELCDSAALTDPRRLLWALLTLFRAMREASLSIGGFYFRDLEAESLAGRCWKQFFLRVEGGLTRRGLESGIDPLATSETLDSFCRRVEGSESAAAGASSEEEKVHAAEIARTLKTLEEKLQTWSGDGGLRGALPLIQLMSYILSYEMNRTYEIWYRTPASFEAGTFNDALEVLQKQLLTSPDVELRGLTDDLAKYPARVKAHQQAVEGSLKGEADNL